MNRARIRPPYPLFRWVAGLAAVPVVCGTMAFALQRMPTLEKVYWAEYLKASYMPDVESIKHFKPLGKPQAIPAPVRKILCECKASTCKPGAAYVWPPPKRLAVTEEPVPPLESLRWVNFVSGWDRAQEKRQFVAWLRENIYGGKAASVFLLTPLFIGLGLAALFFGLGWYVDYERQIRFRDGDRLMRGPVLVSPRQFNKTVKGPFVEIELERKGLAKFTQPRSLKIPAMLSANTPRPSVPADLAKPCCSRTSQKIQSGAAAGKSSPFTTTRIYSSPVGFTIRPKVT